MGGLCSNPTVQLPSASNTMAANQIPQWVSAAGRSLFNNAARLADQNYQPYQGPRVSGVNSDLTSAFQQARNIGNNASQFGAIDRSLGNVSNLTRTAGNLTNFNSRNVATATSADPGNVRAGQFSGAALDRYMDPYVGSVVDHTIGDISRQSSMAANDIGSMAAKMGSFGGSRQALLESELARNTMQEVGRASAEGRSAAFNTALGAFNADADRSLNADLANQQTALSNNQFNAGQRNSVGIANEQNRLDAYNSRMTNYGNLMNLGLQGAATQSDNLMAEQNYRQNTAGALARIGEYRRGLRQQNYDTAYGDFLEAREWPYRQLNFALGALQGTPYDTRTTTNQNGWSSAPGTSPLSQLGGAAATAYGAYRLFS